MENRKLFLVLMLRSVARRRSKSIIAVLSVALVATLVAVMFSLSVGVRGNLGAEMRGFGANIVIYPQRDGALIPAGILSDVEHGPLQARIFAAAPFLHEPVVVSGKPFEIVGTDFGAALKVMPYLKMNGTAPGSGQVAIGADVAQALKLRPGSRIDISLAEPPSGTQDSRICRSCHSDLGRQHERRVSGRLSQVGGNCLSCHQAHPIATSHGYSATVSAIVSSGGEEDGWIVAPLTDVQKTSDSGDHIGYVRVSALTDKEPASKTASRLAALLDGVRPEVVGNVASAETNLLGKVQLLLALLTACVSVMSALGLFSMLGASVLERTKEIGLMKAMGATGSSVGRQFVAESMLLALAGSALGLAIGAIAVRFIGASVFGSPISLALGSIPLAIAACLGLTALASLAAARRAAHIDPAISLRGE